jgi:hypothetical protein
LDELLEERVVEAGVVEDRHLQVEDLRVADQQEPTVACRGVEVAMPGVDPKRIFLEAFEADEVAVDPARPAERPEDGRKDIIGTDTGN